MRLEDGSSLEGDLFLAAPRDGVRTERPSDILNGPGFFPLVVKGEAKVRMVRRNAVVALSVLGEYEQGGELPVEDLAGDAAKSLRLRVRVRGGSAFEGTVVYLLPEGMQRLSDVLNQNDDVLVVREGLTFHLIPKARILDVASLE